MQLLLLRCILLFIVVVGAAVVVFAEQQQQQEEIHVDDDGGGVRKAVVFGATGAVGTEILRSLLFSSLSSSSQSDDVVVEWTDILLIGRRTILVEEKYNDNNYLTTTTKRMPKIHQIVVSNPKEEIMESMIPKEFHTNDNNSDEDNVVCFIAIGSGSPYLQTMKEWYDVDVDLIGTVASKVCKTIFHANHISLLSSASIYEYKDNAIPTEYLVSLTEEEFSDKTTKIGWLRMIYHFFRIKALSEQAVIDSGIMNVRIAQPSQIVTPQSRYGFVDKLLFAILPYIDPYTYPKKWRSIKIETLGKAIVRDMEQSIIMESKNKNRQQQQRIVRLTFEDFQTLTTTTTTAGTTTTTVASSSADNTNDKEEL